MSTWEHFHRYGYTVFRGALDPDAIRRARGAIHRAIPESLVVESVLQFPSLRRHPALTGLLTSTDPMHFVHSGMQGQQLPVDDAHVVLRLPTVGTARPLQPHLDGTHNPLQEQTPPGALFAFGAHLLLYLSDVASPQDGSFQVWPGSHRLVAERIQQEGLDALRHARDGGRRWLSALPTSPPEAITGRCGDVCLCHHLLAHSGSPNLSDEIRYAVVIRIRSRTTLTATRQAYGALWHQWPGLPQPLDERP